MVVSALVSGFLATSLGGFTTLGGYGTLAQTEEPIAIHFLGNEGFLIEGQERSVLVDALVGTSLPHLVEQSSALRSALENAEPPFDRVDLVLTTHRHADHFGAIAVVRHLLANPQAQYVAPQEVIDEIRQREEWPQIEGRVLSCEPSERTPFVLDDPPLTAWSVHHGKNVRVRNNAYRFVVDGFRFLHLGDAEAAAAELEPLREAIRPLDVAFTPSWYLDAKPWVGAVHEVFAPRMVVVMHLAPHWATKSLTFGQRESRARVERIRNRYPDARVFEGEREVLTISADSVTAIDEDR